MAQYVPPLRDMQFVLHEIHGATDVLKALPAHGELTRELADQVLEEGGKFCSEVLFPINRSGDEEGARETFEALIAEYPDFEWPYGNLGCLFIQLGDVVRAKKILRKAIEINPYYVNAWLHMSRAEALDGNYDESYRCLRQVEEIDCDETSIVGIKKLVDEISADDD